jgi:hypothetical protein
MRRSASRPAPTSRTWSRSRASPDIGDQIDKKTIAPLASAYKLSDMPNFNDPAKLGRGKEIPFSALMLYFDSQNGPPSAANPCNHPLGPHRRSLSTTGLLRGR